MANIDEMQKAHEAALATALAGLQGKGQESDWALVRALVHRAVHLCAERKAGEFCAMATLLAEMIGHAHDLQHPGGKAATSHSAAVH